MRIVFLTDFTSEHYLNGTNTFNNHMADILKILGHEIDFIVPMVYSEVQLNKIILTQYKKYRKMGRVFLGSDKIQTLKTYTENEEYDYIFVNHVQDLIAIYDAGIDISKTINYMHHGAFTYNTDERPKWYPKDYKIEEPYARFKEIVLKEKPIIVTPTEAGVKYSEFNPILIIPPYICHDTKELRFNHNKNGILMVGSDRFRDMEVVFNMTKEPITVLGRNIYKTDYSHVTFKLIPNTEVISEMNKHKLVISNSEVEMCPYTLLEASFVTNTLVTNKYKWSEHQPYVYTRDEITPETIERMLEAEYYPTCYKTFYNNMLDSWKDFFIRIREYI